MAYDNLCMYCFNELGGESICPHCGKDSRAAVPQIQMLPGSMVYHDRFLVGRALGQDANGIVYAAMDTKRGGTIRIREYLPRNCAERLNDGGVVPISGMEDAFDAGMKKLRASVESVEDPKKRHFYFEENGTAYIAQRKTSGGPEMDGAEEGEDEDAKDHKRQIVMYIAIAAAVVLVIAIGLIWFLNSMSDSDDVTLTNPIASPSADATWMPDETPTPTPYATATFAALVDPELSWMDYTYEGDVNSEYDSQTSVQKTATPKPTVNTSENYPTVNSSSTKDSVKKLQNYLAKLGWLSSSNITGKYDSATKQAVKDFQNYVNENCSPSKKLAVDGIAGKNTQQWLFNSSISLTKPTPTPTPLVTPAPNGSLVDASSSKTDIKAVQNKLIALGLMKKGSADGVYGTTTAAAVKNFQARVNQLQGYEALKLSGTVDELTMAYLNYYVEWWEQQQSATATPNVTATPTATPAPTQPTSGSINASSTKQQISAVQKALNKVGLLASKDIDGVYGKGTIAAVKSFQQWVNEKKNQNVLAVTGECDVLTQQYLKYAVENNMNASATATPTATVSMPTQTPTQAPTEVPTQAPTQAPTTKPDEDENNTVVNGSSEPESISYVQEMLNGIGLMGADEINGVYSDSTVNAVKIFQQFVNDKKGKQVLNVTGECDALTLQYLEYCSDEGWNVGEQISPTTPPTQAPETEEPNENNTVINGSSEPESISYVQEMLAAVGFLTSENVDGNYGSGTITAVKAFQQWVNQKQGSEVLSVTGECDATTLQYLEYARDNGMTVEGSATEAPTAAPSVSTVSGFGITIAGRESTENYVELEPGSYEIGWSAESGAASYYVYLYDGNDKVLKSAEATNVTGFTIETASMHPGETYTLRVGAMPENGTQDDIVWQTLQLMLPVQATAEPTATPTVKPTVSKPTINIGSSVYQKDGITYISGSEIIFSWMADGDVESYLVYLVDENKNQYELGETTSTSKPVQASQLQPGLYKLFVGARPIDGTDEDVVWNNILFGVPAVEATQTPSPETTQAPGAIIYLDASSSASDIQTVQMKLYTYGLINTDGTQPGVFDQPTREAIAAFQQKVNERYGANLTVIDPLAEDASVDQATLDYLLNQVLDLSDPS